ncbi:alcohol dehydrogenase catalytic domain-containing protein [Streptomyces sp. NPDC087300]|uniref:alcohol dehydrogenase catalytic domain-containing protein n=1 Tax=Streptomyces sp. NPDC087300 TaxID=3365780 RepID=UPI003821E2EE
MARIVRPTAYGTPDVLGIFELRIPRPAAGEVVVGVRAAGVNPIDWKLYSGAFHTVDDEHKESAGVAAEALPALGLECAGVVTAVGVGVTGVELGDEVIAHPVTAAYADYVVAPVTALVRKPATLSWEAAGTLMLSGTTAAHTVHAVGLGRGDTVLVHGGSGGTGLMAVQLATARGATVLATGAERNHHLLRELGAVPLAYGPGLLDRVRAAAPDGVTAAVDCAGTDEALDVSVALVADRTRIASIVGTDRRAAVGVKTLGYGPGQDAGTEVRLAARADLAARAGAGELRVLVHGSYPLYEAARAHKVGIAGHAPGKLVLVP